MTKHLFRITTPLLVFGLASCSGGGNSSCWQIGTANAEGPIICPCDFSSREAFDKQLDEYKSVGMAEPVYFAADKDPCKNHLNLDGAASRKPPVLMEDVHIAEEEITLPDEQPRSSGAASVAESTPSDVVQDDESDTIATNKAEHPEYADTDVQKTYGGKVGKLSAVYKLTFGSNRAITGSYYYPNRPSVSYKLQGQVNDDGSIELREYTKGNLSAACTLDKADGSACFEGTMQNTNGRTFPMSICE
ncbi:hypothetical protein K3G63_06725 [Hymenobacter sp. HSC-4F20]|uniref:hypothetical protein n=1 Tax=Hymenobacter sp. HSC-4F20 TaxID=2864135 RepID=UPI001C72D5A4|nr:hypothetical protein [Hymenobacter sp. HSC-4F20]MBX0290125.1 hypothetical protein [Hymenobacter sp. HSC-4F20]